MTIYLNDLGLVNPLGEDKLSVWKNLNADDFDGLVEDSELITDKSVYCGKVLTTLEMVPLQQRAYDSRNNRLLLTAFKQLESSYNHLSKGLDPSRIAIILGTSTGAMDDAEKQLEALLNGKPLQDYNFLNQEIGGGDHFLAEYLNLPDSIRYTVSTACSSSAKALIAAKRLLENDLADLVIAGGADSLCKLTLNGFNSLESLADYKCMPFAEERNGINIGEGAALFLMSKQESSIKLAGAGETSDAYHMSAPDPEAIGAIFAMNQALLQAGLKAGDIDYLNLHGTATIKNDEMEAKAVKSVFQETSPLISSTKHLTGHMLGAAGVNEIAFCWLAMSNQENYLPPNQSKVAKEFADLNFVNFENRSPSKIRHCMSNSFAFGGNNISVIISKVTDDG